MVAGAMIAVADRGPLTESRQREEPMTTRAPKPSIGAAIAAILLAACTASPSATPGASATAAVAATAVAATAAPTSTHVVPPPTPSGSQVACPSPLPVELTAADALADPTCYGTTDLTIDGWLAEQSVFVSIPETAPSWTMSISGLFPRRPIVREWLFDFLMVDQATGLAVVTPPETGLDVSGTGSVGSGARPLQRSGGVCMHRRDLHR
jgi:hypothetical protein